MPNAASYTAPPETNRTKPNDAHTIAIHKNVVESGSILFVNDGKNNEEISGSVVIPTMQCPAASLRYDAETVSIILWQISGSGETICGAAGLLIFVGS